MSIPMALSPTRGVFLALTFSLASSQAAHAQSLPSDAAAACAALSNLAISPSSIRLPTSGARVLSAALQPPAESRGKSRPEYCKVQARIDPTDPHAQPINVQVNLPSTWNSKAVQIGGAALDGFPVSADGSAPAADGQPTPLSQGYATFGSDSGHAVANPFDADAQAKAFMNDEVLANYGGDQVKKTRDLAVALIQRRYGEPPRRLYFLGSSQGGNEALTAVQRWGGDYDGAVSLFPAAGGVPLVVALGRDARALAAPGAYPDVAKQRLLHRAVLAACDGADGVVDGVVSNPNACRFDVVTLRCPGGVDTGDTCLSDPQIAALRVMASDLRLKFPLASGETRMPGYRLFQGVNPTARFSGLGSKPPAPGAVTLTEPVHFWFYDVFTRGFLMRDASADVLGFNPERPGPWAARLSRISTLIGSSNPDLVTFQGHGGKLILVHGDDDALIPVGWSESYYRGVVRALGAKTAERFMRFYTVPGYGHGVGSFVMDWDALSALDHWVETGEAPAKPIITDLNPATRGRTRPLCRYPTWPRYTGSGSPNEAGSFQCTTP